MHDKLLQSSRMLLGHAVRYIGWLVKIATEPVDKPTKIAYRISGPLRSKGDQRLVKGLSVGFYANLEYIMASIQPQDQSLADLVGAHVRTRRCLCLRLFSPCLGVQGHPVLISISSLPLYQHPVCR